MPRNIEDIIAEELESPEQWMYLSFADSEQFLGAVVILANGMATAVRKCWALGCNPGGEVMASAVPKDQVAMIPEWAKDRLLSREEVEKAFGPTETVN